MRYRRADAAGGIFFTVNLAERRTDVLVRHIGYIHFNPVKHGWVTLPVDWPHSTLHSKIERGMAASNWGGEMGDRVDGYGGR
ncbi:MAG: hypothetical protein K8R50_01600 [Betaproteobacteria bacterium]|nr:hypothetical protein [Betaproteobacteria bacterium]